MDLSATTGVPRTFQPNFIPYSPFQPLTAPYKRARQGGKKTAMTEISTGKLDFKLFLEFSVV